MTASNTIDTRRCSRRTFIGISFAALAAPRTAGNLLASQAIPGKHDADTWCTAAFKAAQGASQAVIRHPFVLGVFAGNLQKHAFLIYTVQNLLYLKNYARCLEVLSQRLSQREGYAQEAQDLRIWAKETQSLFEWNTEYVGRLSGKSIIPDQVKPLPAFSAYADFETNHIKLSDDLAMASLLPCFWIYNQFGLALRPKAALENNPFWEWVEPMGSEEADESCRRAAAIAGRLALEADESERNRMIDVFVAGCWHEWQLFDCALHTAARTQ